MAPIVLVDTVLHAYEQVITGFFRPEAPLTAFDQAGQALRLEYLEGVLGFYRCHDITRADSWHVEAENRSQAPPPRTRLTW